mgnify:CR=1 FL=1
MSNSATDIMLFNGTIFGRIIVTLSKIGTNGINKLNNAYRHSNFNSLKTGSIIIKDGLNGIIITLSQMLVFRF